jgi:hypothetical protein
MEDKTTFRIFEKLDELSNSIADLRVDIAKLQATPGCPNPGLCDSLIEKAKDHERRIDSLEAWRNWVFGIAAAISFFAFAGWEITKSFFTKHP